MLGLFGTIKMLLSSVTTATAFTAQSVTLFSASASELTKSVHVQLAATRKELEQEAGITSNEILLEELNAITNLNAQLAKEEAQKPSQEA